MFCFTIRDLLWLTVVVAVGLAGAVAYRSAQSENRRLQTIQAAQETTIKALTDIVQLSLKKPADFQATPAEPTR